MVAHRVLRLLMALPTRFNCLGCCQSACELISRVINLCHGPKVLYNFPIALYNFLLYVKS